MGCQIAIPAIEIQTPIYAQTVKEVSPTIEAQGKLSELEGSNRETPNTLNDRSNLNISQQSTQTINWKELSYTDRRELVTKMYGTVT